MNQIIVRAFSRTKPKHNISKEHHLWTVLQQLSELKQSSLVERTLCKLGHVIINFAPEGERSRNVVRRSNYRMTGKQPSGRNGRMVHWESHYEKKAFQLLEASPYVSSYREQPAVFEYHNGDGILKKHYPDIYVELTNGIKLFIEVKPDRAKDDQDLLIREALLKNLLTNEGFRYIQIYPDQIESFQYQENAQHMLWHINAAPTYTVREKVKQLISTEKDVTLEKLIGFVNDSNAKSWVFSLLTEGVIHCDLSIPLSGTTLLSMNGAK